MLVFAPLFGVKLLGEKLMQLGGSMFTTSWGFPDRTPSPCEHKELLLAVLRVQPGWLGVLLGYPAAGLQVPRERQEGPAHSSGAPADCVGGKGEKCFGVWTLLRAGSKGKGLMYRQQGNRQDISPTSAKLDTRLCRTRLHRGDSVTCTPPWGIAFSQHCILPHMKKGSRGPVEALSQK